MIFFLSNLEIFDITAIKYKANRAKYETEKKTLVTIRPAASPTNRDNDRSTFTLPFSKCSRYSHIPVYGLRYFNEPKETKTCKLAGIEKYQYFNNKKGKKCKK